MERCKNVKIKEQGVSISSDHLFHYYLTYHHSSKYTKINKFVLFSETHVCLSTHFKCANYFCVPSDKVCDFKDDCGDGSDELECSAYEKKNIYQ